MIAIQPLYCPLQGPAKKLSPDSYRDHSIHGNVMVPSCTDIRKNFLPIAIGILKYAEVTGILSHRPAKKLLLSKNVGKSSGHT